MRPSAFAGMAASAALAACATPSGPSVRLHPQYKERLGGARSIGVVPPKVVVFELDAGGVRQPKDDWSAAARTNVSAAVVNGLRGAGYDAKLLDPAADVKDDLEEVRLLYEAVASSIVYATYGQKFPAKVQNFDYSLGDVSKLLDRLGVDVLAIPYGSDEISSGGRKATQAVGIAAAILLGVGAVQRSGATFVNLAIVDRSGAVVWFNIRGAGGSYDLRDPASAQEMVGKLVQDLPGAHK